MKEKYDFHELKLCPFCKQHAIRVQHPGLWGKFKPETGQEGALFGLWYVGCPSQLFELITKECPIHPSASWYSRLEDAERDWNERNKKE